MAKITLAGDTSGAIKIQAPSVAGTNTLTLPAETGTIALDTTGSILQMVSVVPDPGLVTFTATSFTEVDTGLRLSITPKASDSTLVLYSVFLFDGNNESQMCHIKFYDITNTADVNLGANNNGRTKSHATVRFREHDTNDSAQVPICTTVTSSTTTARTYGVYAKLESTATRYFFANPSTTVALGYAKPIFTIMEVAA
jgi:hypothetical protein